MDSKLIFFAFVALFCCVQARAANQATDLLLGKDKEVEAAPVPVHPIEVPEDPVQMPEVPMVPVQLPEVDESSEEVEAEQLPEVESSEEEEGSAEVEPDVSLCADISGVFKSRKSGASLVLVEGDDGFLSGLFRNSSESAYYVVNGVRGNNEDSAFGVVVIRDQLKGVSAATGVCNACDGSLDMNLINAFPNPGAACKSLVIPMLNYSYDRVGSAAEAMDVMQTFHTLDVEEEASGEE